ncbi:MAG: lysozyme [Desulfurellales bacterium]|nr:MAG: lysozyme [Desulfurellales bacterium]
MIILHCSATKPTMDIGAKEIRKWHTDKPPVGRGWQDIGYHFVIRRNGVVEDGRDLDGDGDIFEEVGAHTVGYNANSIGICMIGGIDAAGKPESNFTAEQWKALPRLLRVIKAKFPKATIHGHNEFAAKDCPSFDVQKWLKENPL